MRFGPRESTINANVGVLCVLCVFSLACGGSGFFKQYEYEEDMYLSLDGSATVYVNSSIDALNVLRGATFDSRPTARFDRDAFRDYYTSPNAHVSRVTSSRRNGRRFVHVRVDIDDVRRLSASTPFAWSTYKFGRKDDLYVYEQTVGAPAAKDAGGAKWAGNELVAFRLHLPSKIDWHNTGREIGRGNILVWEQSLNDRLHAVPLTLEARMQTQSILYRTLWLFGITFVAVAVVFVAVIWWIFRKGAPVEAEQVRRVG